MLSPAWGLAGRFTLPQQLSQVADCRAAWVLRACCCHVKGTTGEVVLRQECSLQDS